MQNFLPILTKYQKHMELRGFAPSTRLNYFQHTNYFLNLHPEVLKSKDCLAARDFLCSMSDNGASSSYIKIAYSALKFFYEVTLGADWQETKMPRLKKSF